MRPNDWRVAVLAALLLPNAVDAQRRLLQPDDLFRVQRVGAIAWSPDGQLATVELHRPGRWLDPGIPTAQIHVLDLRRSSLRPISSSSSTFVGFFGARWSPTGRRLVFLSVDTNAVVRPWLWTAGAAQPRMLPNLELADALADRPVAMWSDSTHIVVRTRDSSRPLSGPLYSNIMRGRNVATAWRQAREARVAEVTVMDSHRPDSAAPGSRIVSVNVRTGVITVLATGPVHRPRLSADGRVLTYRREDPSFRSALAGSFFGPDAYGEDVYDRVNWGSALHHVDARTGAPVPAPDSATVSTPAKPNATLRVTNDSLVGTQLWLARPGRPDTVIWVGNQWVREIRTGRAEAISYVALSGRSLTGWLLYPPDHVPGRAIPIVTVVYPSTIYGPRTPGAFSLFNEHFQHPQMLAALGYGVVVPSMPEPERPMQARALDSLASGVLPLLDTLIARGIADPRRIAVLGQSAGGHAVLGLIALTNRFRTAIASASYANLTSLFGTFYGQYRYGDGGDPQRAQMLRMLQFERGYYGAGAPPWEAPERYRDNSPIERVASIRTPLMLVHGDQDFIPVQQAEEMFTALYRQDKRVRLVRYAGEGHTISARANVVDMWARVAVWLRETMPAR
jgi:dipeptidyl aminopeptidase/acylaminoacyl peptidase